MKKLLQIIFIFCICCLSIQLYAQWFPVMEDVLPVDIAISPDYLNDQTVYVVDDEAKIWISETGGALWTTVYEADNPNDPSQMVLDIIISPNFLNDNAIMMIHKDGTMELSPDRGQHWLTAPAPEGVTGMVFSQRVADDVTMYCITGALGPVNFYKSGNYGATWGDPVAEITLGAGYYSRLWNSLDPLARDTFAIQYDNLSLYLSTDGGVTWFNSFAAAVWLTDFAFSPQFSSDTTVFVAEADEIFKNTFGGDELAWVSKLELPGSFGIRLAISPAFGTDHTIFAAVDQVGIIRSTDGGDSWGPFNEGFNSTLPISIAISNSPPYTLFAGSMKVDGVPDKLYKYQAYTDIKEEGIGDGLILTIYPNPFRQSTVIRFEIKEDCHVRLSLTDLNGRLVSLLLDETMQKGEHAVPFDNASGILRPGLYSCRLEAGNSILSAKLAVTR